MTDHTLGTKFNKQNLVLVVPVNKKGNWPKKAANCRNPRFLG